MPQKLNFCFKKPTNKKEFISQLFTYTTLNVLSHHSQKAIYSWYAQYQETQADAYAIAYAKDPESLRLTAQCLESFDNIIIDFLCGDDALLSLATTIDQWSMKSMRNYLTESYQAEKPDEEFRKWLKKRTMILAYLKSLYDLEHPTGLSRAAIMRAAADALEAQERYPDLSPEVS